MIRSTVRISGPLENAPATFFVLPDCTNPAKRLADAADGPVPIAICDVPVDVSSQAVSSRYPTGGKKRKVSGRIFLFICS